MCYRQTQHISYTIFSRFFSLVTIALQSRQPSTDARYDPMHEPGLCAVPFPIPTPLTMKFGFNRFQLSDGRRAMYSINNLQAYINMSLCSPRRQIDIRQAYTTFEAHRVSKATRNIRF